MIECVVVSVGCGDELRRTAAHNARFLERLTVVTTPADTLSQDVARAVGARLIMTDACYDDDCAFNKAKMLQAGFAGLNPDAWLLCTDADCFLPCEVAAWSRRPLSRSCLYYASRRHVPPETARYNLEAITEQHTEDPQGNDGPWGYFQLAHVSDVQARLGTPPKLPGCFCSAGSIDHWLMSRWPKDRRIKLELTVLHLYHGELSARWNGQERRGRWNFLGQSTTTTEAAVLAGLIRPCRLRRTAILTAEQEVIDYRPGEPPRWQRPMISTDPHEYSVRYAH